MNLANIDNAIAAFAALVGCVMMIRLAIKRRQHTTIIWFNAAAMAFNCFTQASVTFELNHMLGNGFYEIAVMWLILSTALAAFAMYYREYSK